MPTISLDQLAHMLGMSYGGARVRLKAGKLPKPVSIKPLRFDLAEAEGYVLNHPRHESRQAYHEGSRATDQPNPYPKTDPRHELWLEGWGDAEYRRANPQPAPLRKIAVVLIKDWLVSWRKDRQPLNWVRLECSHECPTSGKIEARCYACAGQPAPWRKRFARHLQRTGQGRE